MRVLLVEPYLGGSHQAWAEGYQKASQHDVQIVSHPARWWRWRMRGAFVTLAEECRTLAADGYRPDVMLCTDMLDLAAFRGAVPLGWRDVPTVLYFHESQFTYPDSPKLEPDLSYPFLNWTSALCADRVVFNSEYHRTVFFEEVPRLLRGFPDHRHDQLIGRVRERSSVVPVGVDLGWVRPLERESPPLVMWNHRWEHDKRPDRFTAAMSNLARRGLGFRLALCGENFANNSGAFSDLGSELEDRVVHFGFAERSVYERLLNTSDVVVSTADQEFFGIAMVEAMAAGAAPVLPNRLAYPEILPSSAHDSVLYEEPDFENRLELVLTDGDLRASMVRQIAPHMERFAWRHVGPVLDELLATATVA